MTDAQRIESAILSADDGDDLYAIAKSFLEAGRSRDEVADLFRAVRDRLDREGRWDDRHENKFLNVTDALYGWCHPSVNLCPPE